MELTYQNYHRHSFYSNIMTPDSPASNEDYAKRAVELEHKILSSCEHGYQGYYYGAYELAKKYDLKFIFSAEAYWVKNRLDKDATNSHIFISAKNENGRQCLNDILSEANITGYYRKPRLDLGLILSLPVNDVFLTSACIAFWKYEDIEEIVLKLHNHFQDNFMLEVQNHNTESQKLLNKKILDLSKKYNIDIIMGCDSHFIKESDSKERDNLLEAKGIHYEDEDGWYLDYPSGEEAYNRFIKQGILNKEEILRSMNNTNIFLKFDDIEFNDDIKLPSLYPDKSQEWKDNLYKNTLNEEWKKYKKAIPRILYPKYLDNIRKEAQTVINTKMTDYFLLDYELVKKGKKDGGIISKTARGSGGSFITNTLLGFSNLDRIQSNVKLYPERFMSETRILQTKSLPDLDLNLGTPEIFQNAQRELLGENHAYPMIAFGTLKVKSAFKIYAKSQGLDFTIANDITSQLEQYEKDLKNADDDEKDLLNVYDYVEEKYHSYIDESKKYQGIIDNKKAHPCGWLIYQGDIRKEIGLIKCKAESTGKEVITTVVDGYVAEHYKFLKNDLLKVEVVNLIDKIYKRIGLKQHDINEISKIIKDDNKTWNIYEIGATLGVNQFESRFGTSCCKRYKPKTIEELTALVSALRPGFKSLLDNFLNRLPYSTGVKELDVLLQDSFHYLMYQESIMTYLGWLGIEQTETYAIIKKIAKKKFDAEELKELKERLTVNWIKNVGKIDGFAETWQVVQDASRYSFNASHAYAYAYDSVYGAYLKANYPYEFYEVMLDVYSDKGKKDKVSAFKQEMFKFFGIKEGEYEFGLDNRTFTIDKDNFCINPSLLSIKFLNQQITEQLFALGKDKYNSFLDLLGDIKNKTTVNSRQLNILIMINYFSKFGCKKKLTKIVEYFNLLNNKKQFKKDKVIELNLSKELFSKYSRETEKTYMDLQSDKILIELCNDVPNDNYSIKEQLEFEQEYLGYIHSIFDDKINMAYVLETNTKYSPKLKIYHLDNGEIENYKISKKNYNTEPLEQGDIFKIDLVTEKLKLRKIGEDKKGKPIFEPIQGEYDKWLTKYYKVIEEGAIC